MTDKSRALLKAQARGEVEAANQLNSTLTEDDREHYYLLTLGLFAGVVAQQLGDNPSHDDVVAFMGQMRHDYRNAEPKINPLVIEAMIRAVFGENHLLEDISAEDQYLAQLPVIRKIVAQSESVRVNLDAYLTDAEKLAESWASEAR